MAMTCKICRHRQRAEIEGDLQRGRPLEVIAGNYGISKSALHRHKENCLPLNLTNRGILEVIEGDGSQGPDPLERVENLISRLELMLRKLEKPGKAALFYQGARELCRAMELAERMKSHYAAQFQEGQNRRDREEHEEIQQLARDPVFTGALQQALEEAETRLIESQ